MPHALVTRTTPAFDQSLYWIQRDRMPAVLVAELPPSAYVDGEGLARVNIQVANAKIAAVSGDNIADGSGRDPDTQFAHLARRSRTRRHRWAGRPSVISRSKHQQVVVAPNSIALFCAKAARSTQRYQIIANSTACLRDD